MKRRSMLVMSLASLLPLQARSERDALIAVAKEGEPRSVDTLPRTAEQVRQASSPESKQKSATQKQQGLSSWYGKRFHGKKTASGEIFDMHAMTAAHRTLPFHTWVRVTHLANGRQVMVRINDRGPHLPNRIIDLSHGAARALKFSNAGLARVELEVLSEDEIKTLIP